MKNLAPIINSIVTILPSPGVIGRMVTLTTDNNIYYDDGVSWKVVNIIERIITFGLSGTTTGDRLDASIAIPFSGKIIKWKINSPSNETAEIAIKKNGAVITASAAPIITGSTFSSGAILTGWTTTLIENDILTASVVSKSTVNLLKLQIVVAT